MPSWLKRILPEFLANLMGSLAAAAIIACVSLLASWFLRNIWVFVLTVAALAWIACGYIASARSPSPRQSHKTRPPRRTGQVTWRFPRLRPYARIGLWALPLAVVAGLTYTQYTRALPPKDILVLVATFDGPDPSNYRVTDKLLTHMRSALASYTDVKVESLGRSISAAEGSDVARDEGKTRKASIVIWGWYGVTNEAVSVSTNFEVLCKIDCVSKLPAKNQGEAQDVLLSDLSTFTLQNNLSNELTFLTLYIVGMVRYTANDWDGAIDRLTAALAENTNSVSPAVKSDVYVNRGTAYLKRQDYDHAIKDLDQALSLSPSSQRAYNNRGAAYLGKNDPDRAILDLTQAIVLDPKDATAFCNRGTAYAIKGDFTRAILELSQAILLDPENAEVRSERGMAYYFTGQYDLAMQDLDDTIPVFERYLVANPADADLRNHVARLYNYRASIHMGRNDPSRALQSFDHSIAVDPQYASAYRLRAEAYLLLHDYDRALTDARHAIQLAPENSEGHYVLGLTFAGRDERDLAIAEMRRAVELSTDPRDSQLAEEALRELGVK